VNLLEIVLDTGLEPDSENKKTRAISEWMAFNGIEAYYSTARNYPTGVWNIVNGVCNNMYFYANLMKLHIQYGNKSYYFNIKEESTLLGLIKGTLPFRSHND
jgi:hypothetical protein